MSIRSQAYMMIRDAIANKQQVVATYKGHVREMCPHVIGTKNGKEQALFYQFGGTSSSESIIPGNEDNWRCLAISELRDVSVRDGEWHSVSRHSRQQRCVDNIDLEVEH